MKGALPIVLTDFFLNDNIQFGDEQFELVQTFRMVTLQHVPELQVCKDCSSKPTSSPGAWSNASAIGADEAVPRGSCPLSGMTEILFSRQFPPSLPPFPLHPLY